MMKKLQPYYPSFASAALMWLILFLIYPHYQYYIDPDGTAYLTIARRYATGDLARATNGYWSPWACWLTAGLMRLGMQAIPASVVVNAMGATGFLLVSQSLFTRFGLLRHIQWLFSLTLALFLCYAVFWQSFDDLWECFFLLCSLRLMLQDNFKHKPLWWVLCGALGTLAYFAKAYSFPFFILNTIGCTWLLTRGNRLLWLRVSLTCISVMVLLGMPWIIALHQKYGTWTTSTSGTLNMSWYLVGHPHWKQGIDLLIPPAYPDSPYYWEDPWLANGATPHFWDSWSLFGNEIVRSGYHIVLFVLATLQLSVLFPLVLIVSTLGLLLKNIKPLFSADEKIAACSFVLFPLGYVLVNFESRYLWYMVPLSMLFGAMIIQRDYFRARISGKALSYLFALSYLVVPAWGLGIMYDSGKQEYVLAGQLRAAHIEGSFTGNLSHRFMERLAYFSGNNYYFTLIDGQRGNPGELFKDIRRYKIAFYLSDRSINSSPVYQSLKAFEDSTMLRENRENLRQITDTATNNVCVYRVVD